METMYDRIKRMNLAEMQKFVYAVYLAGVNDGKCDEGYDDVDGYFGGYFLSKDVGSIMPNNDIWDLWDKWELMK